MPLIIENEFHILIIVQGFESSQVSMNQTHPYKDSLHSEIYICAKQAASEFPNYCLI